MPELPDVETFKRYIDSTSLNKKIVDVKVDTTKILENITKKKFKNFLIDKKFVETYRHGKYLFIKNNNSKWLVLHFGMTGFVKYFKDLEKKPDHTRLLIKFENDYYLSFNNQRLFGKIELTDDKDKYIKDKKLGVDALDLDYSTFKKLIDYRKAMIKSTLTNQNIIAGIGNIYSDEILFHTGIDPKTKTAKIRIKKLKTMFENIKKILKISIEAKANPNNFPKNFIIPHRKKEGKCPKCNEKLKTVKVNGRTTYFCPIHQKKK